MASGHRHWTARLAALSRVAALDRAGRRQLRKLLGRKTGLEWRLLGNIRGGESGDALNQRIVANVWASGHVGTWLRGQR